MNKETRQQVINDLADLLQSSPFSVEYKVKKKPQGIKVIIEVTQEQMVELAEQVINKKQKAI